MLKLSNRPSSPPLWRNGFRPGVTLPIHPEQSNPLHNLRDLLAKAPPIPPLPTSKLGSSPSMPQNITPITSENSMKLTERQKRNIRRRNRKQLVPEAMMISKSPPIKPNKQNKLKIARLTHITEMNLVKRQVISKDNHILHLKRIIKHQTNLLKQKDEYINTHIRSLFPYPKDLKPRPHPIKRMYIPEPFLLEETLKTKAQQSNREKSKTMLEDVDTTTIVPTPPLEEHLVKLMELEHETLYETTRDSDSSTSTKQMQNKAKPPTPGKNFRLINDDIEVIREKKSDLGEEIMAVEVKHEILEQSESELWESECRLYKQYRLNYTDLVKTAIEKGDTELDNNSECIPIPMNFHEFAHLNPNKDEDRGEIGDFVYRPAESIMLEK